MNDELMHPVGDDPAWSESYYFNFVDPASRIGMFTRMGFRPGNGWADALHVVYLQGRRVAFTYGRRDIEKDLSRYDGDLSAGSLRLECIEPHQRWQLTYQGPAQDVPDAEVLLTRSKERPDGWFQPAELDMAVRFDCLTPPQYANKGEHGHFEQSGHVTGTIALGDERWEVDGYGVRDKSWGPRDWGASHQSGAAREEKPNGPAPFVNWFSMNFGPDAALGGSCFLGADGVMRGQGWLQRGDEHLALPEVVIQSEYKADSIVHKSVQLKARSESGEELLITGDVSCVCPTKIPMPGGAIFVNEGLTEFRWGDRIGHGIAEHWHGVRL